MNDRARPLALVLAFAVACGGSSPSSTSSTSDSGDDDGGTAGVQLCDEPDAGEPGACVTQWDCDGDPGNGCETPAGTVDDCGGCGIACEPGEACIDGRVCGLEAADAFDAGRYPYATDIAGETGLCVRHGSGVVQCETPGLGQGPTQLPEEREWAALSGWQGCSVAANGEVLCSQFGSSTAWFGDASGTKITDAIDASGSCVLRTDRSVWCFPTYDNIPQDGVARGYELVDMRGAVAMAAGGFPCAVFADGSVHCAGKQLDPFGETLEALEHWDVCATDVVGLAMGTATCMLRANGGVACFGGRWADLLAEADDPRTPVVVHGIEGAIEITMGAEVGSKIWRDTPIARTRDGRVLLASPVADAIEIVALAGAVDVAASDTATCGLMPDGAVVCLDNVDLQPVTNDIPDPCAVSPGACAGFTPKWETFNGNHCAVLENAQVACWGRGTQGLMGQGDGPAPPGVAHVDLGGRVADIQVSSVHACALTEAGEVWCWGNASTGALGIVAGLLPPTLVMSDAVDVSISANTTCAAKTDGTVWCTGGRPIPGVTGDVTVPTQVPGLVGIVEVELAADSYSDGIFARAADGTVHAWRRRFPVDDGENLPVPWCGLTGVDELVGRDGVICARTGAQWACAGENPSGTVEPGGPPVVECPVVATAADGATWLAPGRDASCAVFGDGSSHCFGGTAASSTAVTCGEGCLDGMLGPVFGLAGYSGDPTASGCALPRGSWVPLCWSTPTEALPDVPFRYVD